MITVHEHKMGAPLSLWSNGVRLMRKWITVDGRHFGVDKDEDGMWEIVDIEETWGVVATYYTLRDLRLEAADDIKVWRADQ